MCDYIVQNSAAELSQRAWPSSSSLRMDDQLGSSLANVVRTSCTTTCLRVPAISSGCTASS